MTLTPSQQNLINALNGENEKEALDAVARVDNVNFLTEQNLLPLHIACQKPWETVVRAILEKGAKTLFKNPEGLTSLHIAQNAGFLSNAACLVEHNPTLCTMGNRQGLTPLHEAARDNRLPFLHCYLKLNKININVADIQGGSTPLHEAAKNGHSHIVEILIANGANQDLYDKKGKKSADYVIEGLKEKKNSHQSEDLNQALFPLSTVPSLRSLASCAVLKLNHEVNALRELLPEHIVEAAILSKQNEAHKTITFQRIETERARLNKRAEDDKKLAEIGFSERLSKLAL